MSFYLVPTYPRTPAIPNFSVSSVWRGTGADAYILKLSCSMGHIMTYNRFCYSLRISRYETFDPVFNDVNGYIYWQSEYRYIYYSLNYDWIICDKFPGYEPIEEYDPESEKYSGDQFWSSGDIPRYDNPEGMDFIPRGSLRNTTDDEEDPNYNPPRNVKFYLQRWRASFGEYGDYEPASDVSGVRYFGIPRWRGSNDVYYPRSMEKVDGHFSYGDIHYRSGKWLIGTPGDENGHYEGAEPNKENPVTFKFTAPENSEITRSDIIVTLRDYIRGDEKQNIYLGEAAIWR